MFRGWRRCHRAQGLLTQRRHLMMELVRLRYGLQPAAISPRFAEKNVSDFAACSRAAHQAAASLVLTWPTCTSRSIVPRLSCW